MPSRRLALLALVCLIGSAPLAAADFQWDGASGDWTEVAHWQKIVGGVPSAAVTVPGAGDTATIAAGVVEVSTTVSVQVLHISSAELTGGGALTLLGAGSTWDTSARLSGTGVTTVAPGATLTAGIDGSSPAILTQRSLVNRGVLTIVSLFCTDGANVTNAAGGVADLHAVATNGGQILSFDGSPITITNAGTVTKSGTTSGGFPNVFAISDRVALTSTGPIAVQSGTLSIQGGGSQTAGTTVAAGTILEVAGATDFTFLPGSAISGAGRFQATTSPGQAIVLGGYALTTGLTVSGNLLFAPTGAVAAQPFLDISGGTFTQNVPLTCALLHLDSGDVEGTGTLTLTGVGSTWQNSSTLGGSGLMTVAPGATLQASVDGSAPPFLAHRTLVNHGVLTIKSLLCTQGATLANAADGTLDFHAVANTGSLISAFDGTPITLTNAGTLTRSGATGLGIPDITTIGDRVTLASTGLIAVQTGTLSIQGGGSQAGTTTVAAGETLEIGGITDFTFTATSTISGAGTFHEVQNPGQDECSEPSP